MSEGTPGFMADRKEFWQGDREGPAIRTPASYLCCWGCKFLIVIVATRMLSLTMKILLVSGVMVSGI